MANVRLATATQNALAQQIQVLADAGASGGTIKIYDGTQPATGNTGLSGNTLLGTLTLSKPSAGSASAGILTLNSITSGTAVATGTATWARIQDSNANNVCDCDVTATGGGGTIQLNTTSIVSGGPIAVTSFTFTMPAS